MKTITKTTFSDPTLEDRINSLSIELPQKVIIAAKLWGQKNLPLPVGDSLKSYFEKFFYEGQQLIDFNNSRLQFHMTGFEVSEIDRQTAEEHNRINIESARIEEALIPIDAELDRTAPPNIRRRVRIAWWIIIVVSLFDAIGTFSVFQAWQYALLPSLIMGALFGAVLIAVSHLTPFFIKKGRTPREQRIIALVILVFLIAMFSLFAITRSATLVVPHSGVIIPTALITIAFILMSTLLFATAVGAYLKYMPSKAEREAQAAYDKKVERAEKLRQELAQLESARQEATLHKMTVRFSNASILSYGNSVEHRVIHLIKAEYANFKTKLLSYRTDGAVPNWYHEPFPFTFNRYFHSID